MKLLVALDLSDCTEKILDQVVEIALPLKASIWLIHNGMPEPDTLEFKVDPLSAREDLAKKFHFEHQKIQEYAGFLREKGLDTTALLVHGTTVDTILEAAEKLDVNMILMGSHGRGAMYQLILGSVSEGVIHKSKRPVLIIPTRELSGASSQDDM